MLQQHWNIEYSLSIHLCYGRIYLLALSCRMVTKGRTHLHNPAVERWRFGTTRGYNLLYQNSVRKYEDDLEHWFIYIW